MIPVTLSGSDPVVQSGQTSRGHRLYSDAVAIPSADDYASALAGAGVVAAATTRFNHPYSCGSQCCSLGCGSDLPEDLFEELTDLVETPLIEGSVADHYLALPAEVLSTVACLSALRAAVSQGCGFDPWL